jgi:cell division protein FtsQ
MWGIGTTKKLRKKRKKKKAGAVVLAKAAIAVLWHVIKIPTVFASIGLVFFFIWFHYTGDYGKLRAGILSIVDISQKNSGAVLETILLDGHQYTPKEEILAAVTGKETHGKVYIGYPMMKIDLWHIKNSLEKLTWIKHASVTRQLPSTLSISVLERQPMALWQNNGKISLIDSDGEIINETNLEKFSNLIILVGSNVPYHAGHFLKFISTDPAIATMIASGVLVNGRRWNVKLKNDILIKLPEDNPETSWEYLTKKQRENKILESNIKTIDLRIEKKMFVR